MSFLFFHLHALDLFLLQQTELFLTCHDIKNSLGWLTGSFRVILNTRNSSEVHLNQSPSEPWRGHVEFVSNKPTNEANTEVTWCHDPVFLCGFVFLILGFKFILCSVIVIL